jgi:hypothetical protein
MVILNQLVCMNTIPRLPRVIAVGISLPLEEIFQLPFPPFESVINHGFYFVLVFSSDQFGWRSDEIWPV